MKTLIHGNSGKVEKQGSESRYFMLYAEKLYQSYRTSPKYFNFFLPSFRNKFNHQTYKGS